MGDNDLPPLIDRLGAAALECKQLLSDVHAATKDMRQATRELDEKKREVKQFIEDEIRRFTDERVRAEIQELSDSLPKFRDAIIEAFGKLFDEMTNIYVYGNSEGDGNTIFEDMRKTHRPNLT